MKIEKKLDELQARVLARIFVETDGEMADLERRMSLVASKRADAISLALRGDGFESSCGESLNVDLKSGTATWDDGKPAEDEFSEAKKKALEAAEKRKALKEALEAGKDLADRIEAKKTSEALGAFAGNGG